MDSLTPEQQALFASIMGNSSQAQALTPNVPKDEVIKPPSDNGNRVLSQAEIDALIASMN